MYRPTTAAWWLGTYLITFFLGFQPAQAQAGPLNIDGWLHRPGVKLLAVEFFATWCKPCMEAIPRWKALHEKYRKDGLRLIVVSTRDANGSCASPGWSPDEVVCDDDGVIADRFGVKNLPSAYLWGWQGQLLASNIHVAEMEKRIETWMNKAPRVAVQVDPVARGRTVDRATLRDAARTELQRADKMVVVATERERRLLRNLVRKSLELGRSEEGACEVGEELSANSLVRVTLTRGRQPQLQLKLLSAERGCLIGVGATRWNPAKLVSSMGEATAALLDKLRLPTQYPWSRMTRPALESRGLVIEQKAERNSRRSALLLPKWLSLGASVLSGAGAGLAFIVADQARRELNEYDDVNTISESRERLGTYETVGFIAGGTAVGFAALSAILFMIDKNRDHPAPTAAILPDGRGGVVGFRAGF
ncbi:MAG: TlpA family protein disulfide reductase [Myxococcales bacterium]|nr:TlpA family protein disulfide reductase [Myxococcales bacterium]